MCVFSVSPVLVILIESFTAGNYISFPPESFSIKWYMEFLKRDEFIESVYVSLYVALMASVTSTLIGLIASVAMFRYSFFGKKIINLLRIHFNIELYLIRLKLNELKEDM